MICSSVNRFFISPSYHGRTLHESGGVLGAQVSLKTEWLPPLGYETVEVAREDLGRYLLGYYNWKRPHQANGGLAPARAEQQLKMVSGFY